MAKVPDASKSRQVGCITCHRAAEKPPRQLDEIVHTEVVAKGVGAGLAVYERAIAADPANGFARQLLEKLKTPETPRPPD